jgi:hypothetical protein
MKELPLGTFITGKDRSYMRSIYKILAYEEACLNSRHKFYMHFVLVEFCSFDGRGSSCSEKNTLWPKDRLKHYRKASFRELKKEGLLSNSVGFICKK